MRVNPWRCTASSYIVAVVLMSPRSGHSQPVTSQPTLHPPLSSARAPTVAMAAPHDPRAIKQFLDEEQLGLLEKPLGFATDRKYNNLMCCCGCWNATITVWCVRASCARVLLSGCD